MKLIVSVVFQLSTVERSIAQCTMWTQRTYSTPMPFKLVVRQVLHSTQINRRTTVSSLFAKQMRPGHNRRVHADVSILWVCCFLWVPKQHNYVALTNRHNYETGHLSSSSTCNTGFECFQLETACTPKKVFEVCYPHEWDVVVVHADCDDVSGSYVLSWAQRIPLKTGRRTQVHGCSPPFCLQVLLHPLTARHQL